MPAAAWVTIILATLAFTLIWPNPLGIHAGFWGLMVNLPLFVIVSCLTPPVRDDVVERFFELAIPGRLPSGRR